MKPFRVRKVAGGQHLQIFVRNKLPRPKVPLAIFTKIHPQPRESVSFDIHIR